MAVALGFALLAGLVALAFWLAGRLGFGPLAPLPAADDPVLLAEPASPAPRGWLRPGWGFGIPVLWMFASLLVIPLVVYVISYIPWALNGTGQQITNAAMPILGAWPPGHTGDTLWDLTQSMYHYHDTLRATHAASSPWWAWPFDLKPVWFYQGSFAGNTAASIYDAGNLVIWWLGIPAMAFVAWQAFKRRSLALALLGVGFAWQWLAWSRIDRATFQYHYYTFVVVGLDDTTPLFASRGFSTEPVAFVGLCVLGFLAAFVVSARDSRRFVAGAVFAAVAAFLVFYPNISALPLPAAVANSYQGLLPTYLYPFQFPVNTDPAGSGPNFFARGPLGLPAGPILLVGLIAVCLVVAYSAWAWRIALAERAAEDLPGEGGDAAASRGPV